MFVMWGVIVPKPLNIPPVLIVKTVVKPVDRIARAICPELNRQM